VADFEGDLADRCVALIAGRRQPIERFRVKTVLAAMSLIVGGGEGGQTDKQPIHGCASSAECMTASVGRAVHLAL
jgi:hypothetical protein